MSSNKEEINRYLRQGPSLTKAVVCFFVRGDQVLLGLRKKVSLDLGLNLISGIGGKLEPGESPEQALIREVEEEIVVTVKKYEDMGTVTFLFPHKPKWNQFVTVYRVTEWEGEPQETEPIKPMGFKISELPEKQMWADNLLWVPKVLRGEKVKATFLYGEGKKVVEYRYE